MTLDYKDKGLQRTIRHIFCDMDLCGCGSCTEYEIIHALLERADSKGSFYEPLEDRLSSEAVELIAKVISSSMWDLLEHGTSVGGSWLTERGKILLQFFRDLGTNDEMWPSWHNSCDKNEEW